MHAVLLKPCSLLNNLCTHLACPQAADKSPKPGAAAANGKNQLLGTLRRFVSPVSTACGVHAQGCVL